MQFLTGFIIGILDKAVLFVAHSGQWTPVPPHSCQIQTAVRCGCDNQRHSSVVPIPPPQGYDAAFSKEPHRECEGVGTHA